MPESPNTNIELLNPSTVIINSHISIDEARSIMSAPPSDCDQKGGNNLLMLTNLPDEVNAAVRELAERRKGGEFSQTAVIHNLKQMKQHCKKVLNVEVTLESLQEDYYAELSKLEEKALSNEEDEKSVLSEEQLNRAKQFGQRDLVSEFQLALRTLGYVADRYTALALMHTVYSRLLTKRIGSLHHGSTRSGKSAGLEAAFKLLHPENRLRATSITVGAIYELGCLNHIFILGGELKILRPGEDDITQQVLRQFLSEPELTHHRLEESRSLKGKSYVLTSKTVSGYASIAWTTTRDVHDLKDEFALRLTSYKSNESPAVTADVQTLTAQRAMHPIETDRAEQEVISTFNELDISFQPMLVKVPFAYEICLESSDTTVRAIYDLLLTHTKISALINQHKPNRLRTDDGCIEATFDDYEIAYELVMKGAFRILEPAGEESRKAFEKAKENWPVGEGKFGQQELADFLQKKRSTAQGYLKQWLAADMAEELFEQGPKGKKLYMLTDYLPKAQDLGLIKPALAKEKYLARQQELSNFEKSDSHQAFHTISQRELLPDAGDLPKRDSAVAAPMLRGVEPGAESADNNGGRSARMLLS